MKIKEALDIVEDICTILVSIGAVWGAFVAWESGFLHKLDHIVTHYHNELSVEEHKLKNIPKDIKIP